MHGFVFVAKNPYFAVVDDNGKFEISGVPAGSYEIVAWHEKLGTQTSKVTVGDSDTQTVDFAMSVPNN